MRVVNLIRRVINPLGLDIVKNINNNLRRRRKMLKHNKISKVLDVGANSGQYANELFVLGYNRKIISFEPVKSVFDELNAKANNNKNWTAFNFGLGNKEEEVMINISKNTYSSSLLEMMPNHIKSAPESKYTHKETVRIKTIDSIYDEIINDNEVVFLKLDVQGFERNVLEGAKNSLKNIKGVQIEMSLEELYKGEMLFVETIKLLKTFGYNLHSLENGFCDSKSGKLLQVDGIFFKD